MKKIFLLLVLVILNFCVWSQQDTTKPVNIPISDSIYSKVDIEASFPGGVSKWRQYLEQSLNPAIPLNRGAPAGTYTVIVQFIVNKDGKISDIKPLTKHGFGMEDQAIKAIRTGPKWIPAQVNGVKVNSYRKQPFTFQFEIHE